LPPPDRSGAEQIQDRSAPCHHLLGRRVLRAERDSGRSELSFEAPEAFTNGMDNVQGGLLASMLDSVMGAALATVLAEGERSPTLEIKVSFIKPAKVGTIGGTARVVHRGKSVAFVEGELHDSSGALLATATSTARITRV
jgi:uncharacterized protein (TIGR00369 family)